MFRLLTVVGARPQFIKSAAISHTIRQSYSRQICEDLLHTGQHYDDSMSGAFFRELDLPAPRYQLRIPMDGASSEMHLSQMKEGVVQILQADRYDGVLVYGDTTSTLAGALAAQQAGVPLFHVEAGLRSFNPAMPEEHNRVQTDRLSALLFAPTPAAVENLHREGFEPHRVRLVGDVMLDNVRHYASLSAFQPPFPRYVFATLHRNFNTDTPARLHQLLRAIAEVGRRHDMPVLMPLHPRTRKVVDSMVFGSDVIHFVSPMSYLDTLGALTHADLVLTDSGGLQKEAAFCHCPCVVLREETEWVELVGCGAAVLAGCDMDSILQAANRMMGVRVAPPECFGDGQAAHRIVEQMLTYEEHESSIEKKKFG